ncbi:MAG: hypothetical protein J4F97_04150 [Pseudomonadales bacterium]|nr:hypothetical protein [Pseudomonadales bacterium]
MDAKEFKEIRNRIACHPSAGVMLHTTNCMRASCELIGPSVDSVQEQEAWLGDIEAGQGHAMRCPLIRNPHLEIAKIYEMLPENAGTSSRGRTPIDYTTARSLFLIASRKRICQWPSM